MSTHGDAADFRTTRWSMVRQASQDSKPGEVALEELCGAYWYPLYALARRAGEQSAGAEDLVQGFFADLLSRGDVGRADPGRGRFRAFLVTAFQHFRSNQHNRARAQKRGGSHRIDSLDRESAEARYDQGSGKALDPEALFDRAWALTLLESALARLRASYQGRGQEQLFDALRPAITSGGLERGRPELAAELGLSEGALKVAIHRLRERYSAALMAEVRDTVADDGEVEQELSDLFEALGG